MKNAILSRVLVFTLAISPLCAKADQSPTPPHDDIKIIRAQIAADLEDIKNTDQLLIPANQKVKRIAARMFVVKSIKARHLKMAEREVETLKLKKFELQVEISELGTELTTLHTDCPECEQMLKLITPPELLLLGPEQMKQVNGQYRKIIDNYNNSNVDSAYTVPPTAEQPK